MASDKRKFSSERSRWYFPNTEKEELIDFFSKNGYLQGQLIDIPDAKPVVYKVNLF
jgi:hypothetical protein